MYDFGACPRCQMELPSERLRESVIVCSHCGYTATTKQNNIEKQAEKRFVKVASTICGLMTVFLVLTVQWDTFVFEIIPLKAKQMTGAASPSDLLRIREICEERKNVQCQLESSKQLARHDNEAFAHLGKLQFLMGDNKKAIQSFTKYFDNGGLSLDASYHFARSLEKDGQVEQASQYYESILAAKPDTLQITVTKNYIKMLIEYNKKNKARLVLSEIRKKGANTQDFMGTVFKELERTVR